MLGKLLLGAAAVVGLYEGGRWWWAHKSQHALRGGHDYLAVIDYTGTVQEPLEPSAIQANLDASHPGQFTVIGCDTDAANKQIKLSFEAMTDEYVTGDEITLALPPILGKTTMASLTDAGALSSQGGGSIPFSPGG